MSGLMHEYYKMVRKTTRFYSLRKWLRAKLESFACWIGPRYP